MTTTTKLDHYAVLGVSSDATAHTGDLRSLLCDPASDPNFPVYEARINDPSSPGP